MDEAWRLTLMLAVVGSLVFSLSSLALLHTPSQRGWSEQDFPNPRVDAGKCRSHRNQSWVCDPDGLLPTEGWWQIDLITSDIWMQCRHMCADRDVGYQVAVAVARNVNASRWAGDTVTAAEALGESLWTAWGLNQTGCEDGVLLLLLSEPSVVRLTVGRGVRALFPPDVEGIILARAQAGLEVNVAHAIASALLLIWDVLDSKDIRHSSGDPSLVVVIGVMVAFTCGLPLVVRLMELVLWGVSVVLTPVLRAVLLVYNTFMAFPRAALKMREKLHRIQREVEGLSRNSSYHQRMCAICLEDFPECTAALADATPLMGAAIQRLNCQHRFHDVCIREWMETSATMSCPLCREAIDIDDLDGPSDAEQTYRAWLRYYLSRLYAQHPVPASSAPLETHVDYLYNNRNTDWYNTGLPAGSYHVPWASSWTSTGVAQHSPSSSILHATSVPHNAERPHSQNSGD